MGSLCIFSCLVLYIVQSYADETQIACYDDRGLPQRCIPPFENAAFDVNVEASNTCGLVDAEEYCLQTGATKSCTVCDAHVNSSAHPASFLTDFHNSKIPSWWQSQTMLQDVQYPRSVNLTLNLGKLGLSAFLLTTFSGAYLRIEGKDNYSADNSCTDYTAS